MLGELLKGGIREGWWQQEWIVGVGTRLGRDSWKKG